MIICQSADQQTVNKRLPISAGVIFNHKYSIKLDN